MENKFTINEQKIVELFFNFPTQPFSAREIARLTKITHPTVSTALKKLKKLDLVELNVLKNRSRVGRGVSWISNQDNTDFKELKRVYNFKNLYSSNLIKKIVQETAPNSIVLFGSYSRGEDTEESDIDLLVVSKEKKINLKFYEKKLKRKINIMFVQEVKEIKSEFCFFSTLSIFFKR